MHIQHQLERVIVVPVNGYANRLQAWASAAILAAELDVPCQVLWEPERVAPATPETLFTEALLRRSFTSPADFRALVGSAPSDMPRYLHRDDTRGVVSLAGHDLGEQALIPDLLAALSHSPSPTTLVIIAGGKYSLPDDTLFARRRQVFYSGLDWSQQVRERVAGTSCTHAPYVALHVRGTDRSLTAPTRSQVRQATTSLHARFPDHSLFISSDTDDSARQWTAWAQESGLQPWVQKEVDRDRTNPVAGIDAVVDWILLGKARAGVGALASSFAEEAAIAGGHAPDWLLLEAPVRAQRVRAARMHGRNALTMPRRRLRRHRTDGGD